MRKLHGILLLSLAGFSFSISAMIASKRIVKMADEVLELDSHQFEDLASVVSEEGKMLLEASSQNPLEALTGSGLTNLLLVVPLLRDAETGKLTEHLGLLLKNKQYEKYLSLLITADFLGVESLLSVAILVRYDFLFNCAKRNLVKPLRALFGIQQKYPHLDLVDIESQGRDGETILIWAVMNDNTPVVALLLEHGVDVDHQDALGETALMFSAVGYYKEITQMLLSSGASIDIQDEQGRTALMWAALKPDSDRGIVELLLNAKAAVDKQDRQGKTALDLVISSEIKKLLTDTKNITE